MVANSAADGTRRALGRFEVHQQPRPGVDLHNCAALGLQRARDVFGHHVNPGNVQPHHPRCERHGVGHLGVNQVGAVDGNIAVALNQHTAASGWHSVWHKALPLQVQHDGLVLVDLDAAERKVLFQTAPGVGVELGVHQLRHGVHAVASDTGHIAARSRHHAAPHHQQPVLVAANKALHHHIAAVRLRHLERSLDLVACRQFQRHAASVVAVGRLDHHRQADVLGGFPGFSGTGHKPAFRHRHTAGRQQTFGQVLVVGNALGNRAGQVGFGCPDAALACAVAQLHQVAVVQPDVRNTPLRGGSHNGSGAGPQITIFNFGTNFFDGGLHVLCAKRGVVDRRHQQLVALGQGGACHLLLARPEHHAVHPAPRGAAGLAKAGWHIGQVQQLDHHMLQHMAGPGAFAQALQKAAAFPHTAMVFQQRWQQGCQAARKARQQVGREVFQCAQVKPHLQHRAVSPDVGAAQVVDAQQLNVVVLVTHEISRQTVNRGWAFQQAHTKA